MKPYIGISGIILVVRASNSWKMVIATLVIGVALPVANAFLPADQQIHEDVANNALYMFLGSGAIGAASKIGNNMRGSRLPSFDMIQSNRTTAPAPQPTTIQQPHTQTTPAQYSNTQPDTMTVQSNLPATLSPPIQIQTAAAEPVPPLNSDHGFYRTNMERFEGGNGIKYSEPYLWVQVKDPGMYVAGVIIDENGKALQVEQSGSRNNPWTDTIRFELYSKEQGGVVRKPYPKGTYRLEIRANTRTTLDAGTGDEFCIV